MAVDWALAVELVPPAALVGVGLWLVALDPRSRAHVALALFLVLRAVDWAGDDLFTALGAADTGERIDVLTNGPAIAALVFFLLVFPRPRTRLATARWGWVPFAVVGGAYVAAGLAFPRLVTNGDAWTPFLGLGGFMHVVFALAGLLLFREFAAGAAGGASRTDHLLLGLGFAIYEADMATATLRTLSRNATGYLDDVLDPWGAVYVVSRVAVLVVLVLCAGVLSGVAGRGSREPSRRAARAALVVLGLAAVASFAMRLAGDGLAVDVLEDILDLALPALIVYAVVHHRLFDIDLKVKWTIRRGTVVAAFLVAFFVVAEVTQSFLSESVGWAFGGVVAGVMLFAIRPLERVADRVAEAALPGVVDPRTLAAASGKEDAYRAALQMALADGVVTRAEERALAKLAHELGIPAPRALDLREEAERAAGA